MQKYFSLQAIILTMQENLKYYVNIVSWEMQNEI